MTASTAEAVAALGILVLALLVLWQVAWRVFRLTVRFALAVPRNPMVSRTWRRSHPIRAALRDRFPRTYGMIERRLEPRRFAGLPLTLMVVAACYLAALLGGLVAELLEAEDVVAMDDAISGFLQPYRSTFLVGLLVWVTQFGAQPALTAVAIVSTGFLWADRRALYIPPVWIAILGSQATTWIGKFGFDRVRPEFTTIETAVSPSFPSAHATGAMAVYGIVAYAIARDGRSARQRFEITYWTLVLILLIGFSRIFLGVHFASDVAAGLLVGGFWLLVAFAAVELRREPGRGESPPDGPTA